MMNSNATNQPKFTVRLYYIQCYAQNYNTYTILKGQFLKQINYLQPVLNLLHVNPGVTVITTEDKISALMWRAYFPVVNWLVVAWIHSMTCNRLKFIIILLQIIEEHCIYLRDTSLKLIRRLMKELRRMQIIQWCI